jgi:ABC-type sugar transport system ATPase subunit
MTALVQLSGVPRCLAGIRVRRDLDFDLQQGEGHALPGEHGAGNSTLIKIIAGTHDSVVIRPSSEVLKSIASREAAKLFAGCAGRTARRWGTKRDCGV